MKEERNNKPVRQKIFIALACILVTTIPLPPIYNSLATIVMFLYWLVFVPKKINKKISNQIILISTLFWMALAGLVYSQNKEEALFRIFEQKILLLVYPLVFLTADVDRGKVMRWISLFFVVTVAAICIACLGEAIYYWQQHQSTDHFFSHGLAQGIDFYPYVLSILCLASAVILAEVLIGKHVVLPFFRIRRTAVLFIVFFIVFILLLSVVQVILITITLALIYSFRLHISRKMIVAGLALAISIVGVLSFTVPPLKKKINDTLWGKQNSIPLDRDASLGFIPWNGIAMRKAVWTCSLDVIKNNFWLGVGTGDGQDQLQQAYEKRQFYFASRYNRFNTHNQYLQVWVNFGVVGLTVWLLSVAALFFQLRGNELGLYLLGICVLAMLTESMLETNKGIVTMALLLSLSTLKTLHQPTKK